MPAGNVALGGTLFFGFSDVGASITSVEYFAGAFPGGDATGIDDVRFGVVPIPSAIWLFGSGLFALIGIARSEKPT